MGVDLDIIPVDHESSNCTFGHTTISLERDRPLWEHIRLVLDQMEFGQPFSCSMATIESGSNAGERCYGDVSEDCYGNSLKYCFAGSLAKLIRSYGDTYQGNIAAAAYLENLPEKQKIILYWH